MKKIISLFVLLTFVFTLSAKDTSNEPSLYIEGLHYKLIEPAYPLNDKNNIIIHEFFSYRCPHCATFQPYMKSLEDKLPEYVKVIHVPLGFNPSWKLFAQAYYTAQSMNILEQSHLAMFNALHTEHKKMRTLEEIAKWYAENYKIDEEKFLSTAKSFMIDGMIKKGNNLAIQMKVPNTPKLVINGKFMPEIQGLRSKEAVIESTLYFIEQEAKAMNLLK